MAEFDRAKFKNLMHHVAWQVRDRDGWGLTKLFKAIWFFEARRYSLHGERFTGARYKRDEFGPRPREAYPMLQEMTKAHLIRVVSERYFNKTLKRVIPLVPPRGGLLNEEQDRDLGYWISYVGEKTADEISAESHDLGWEIIPQGDDIPLNALLIERIREPEGEELDWALSRVRELGLP